MSDRLSAGQARALRRLSFTLARWRCPACLEDARHPAVSAEGIVCPFCAHVDQAHPVQFTRRPTRAGFTWTATREASS